MKDKSILIVEMDAILTLHLKELLKKSGYDVVDPVTSGEDAIQYLKKFSPPDLILMDMTLDGSIDGVETTRQIRRSYDIPVVFLSPLFDRHFKDGPLTPSGFIMKPLVESDVLSVVEKVLRP